MADVLDGTQLRLFDNGEPVRIAPSESEILAAASSAARINLWKHYRGRPPRGWDWEDLEQEIVMRTFHRMRNFRHGGPKTIDEYAYVSAYHALIDICREHMIATVEPREYPLLEQLA